ncbi:hypothetical protein BDB00DRAFT_116013 [Zychaea mexicana]|uniref:uncharacterized protein n=1 Tax=Zychaea mexicana TaxID=64656 RepID=UPI0022FE476B|nr:uncharacterized protein BDB00DRAFT_116013 [Zychaea mexicana]KAI9484709.1 hypothetical protein BDB00DRAFT_116013 [Zychaea mexicana]
MCPQKRSKFIDKGLISVHRSNKGYSSTYNTPSTSSRLLVIKRLNANNCHKHRQNLPFRKQNALQALKQLSHHMNMLLQTDIDNEILQGIDILDYLIRYLSSGGQKSDTYCNSVGPDTYNREREWVDSVNQYIRISTPITPYSTMRLTASHPIV